MTIENLVIRFGKVGDGVTAINLARSVNLGRFYSFGLIPKAEECCRLISPNYLGEISLLELLYKSFGRVIVYNHPKPSVVKKIVLKIMLVLIRKKALVELNDHNQYASIKAISKKLDNENNKILVAPSSAEGAKNLSVNTLNELLESLVSKTSKVFYIVSDQELKILGHERVINLSGKTNMNELISLVKNSSLVLTVDSAPFHLAQFFGVDTYLLNSARHSEDYWFPCGYQTVYKDRDIICGGCNKIECPYGPPLCINNSEMQKAVEHYLIYRRAE